MLPEVRIQHNAAPHQLTGEPKIGRIWLISLFSDLLVGDERGFDGADAVGFGGLGVGTRCVQSGVSTATAARR